MKALKARKHVLVENPVQIRLQRRRRCSSLFAEEQGPVLLEAFDYRYDYKGVPPPYDVLIPPHEGFTPSVERFKAIVDSGELGAIKSIEAKMMVPKGFVTRDDIRFQFELGGGALMD